MLPCRELSRLTKVPRFTSILWRNQTPGSPQSVLDNSYVYLAKNAQFAGSPTGSSTSKVATLLDSSHPATKLKPQQIPSWQVDGIKIKLVPMALLQRPASMCGGADPFSRMFVPWVEKIQHMKKASMKVVSPGLDDYDLFLKLELGNTRLPGCRSIPQGALKKLALKKLALRIPMSYLTATSKERMGPKRYMRRRITTRIKTALNLIVTRGAYVDQSEIQNGADQLNEDRSKSNHKPLPPLKFDNQEASLMGEKWIMQGWSYIFYPTSQVYNMSYPKLVSLLRQGLQSLYDSATKLERQWLKEAFLPQSPRLKQQKDSRRTNKDTREKPTKPAIEPSTQGRQVETPKLTPDSAYGILKKPQKSDPIHVPEVENLKSGLWELQLRSGLAIMQERLGKRR